MHAAKILQAIVQFSTVDAELARVETRRASVVELDTVKAELADLQATRASVQEELAALKSQADSVKAQRETEAQELNALAAQRAAIAANIGELNDGLQDLSSMHKDIQMEIVKDRPVKEITGVDSKTDTELREQGIRTVDELSRASVEDLTASGVIDRRTAGVIIADAQNRVVVR